MTVNGVDYNTSYTPPGVYYNRFTNTCMNLAIFQNEVNQFNFDSFTSSSGQIDYVAINRRNRENAERRRIQQNLADTTRIGATTTDAEERAVRDSLNRAMKAQRETAETELQEVRTDQAIEATYSAAVGMAGFTLMNELPEWHRHYTSELSRGAYSRVSRDALSQISGSSRREVVRALNESKRALEHLERGFQKGRISQEVFLQNYGAHQEAVRHLMNNPADDAALNTLKNITNVTREAAGPGAYCRAFSRINPFSKAPAQVTSDAMKASLDAAKNSSTTATSTTQAVTNTAQQAASQATSTTITQATTTATKVSRLAKVGNFLKTGVKYAGGKLGVGIAAVASCVTEGFNIYAAFQQNKKEGWKQVGRSTLNIVGQVGGYIAGAALGAKLGATIGGTLGTIVPGIGNVIGIAVGAAAGAIGGLVCGWLGKKIFGDPEKEQIKAATKGIAHNDPNARNWQNTFIQLYESGQIDQNDETLASAYQKYRQEIGNQAPAVAQ